MKKFFEKIFNPLLPPLNADKKHRHQGEALEVQTPHTTPYFFIFASGWIETSLMCNMHGRAILLFFHFLYVMLVVLPPKNLVTDRGYCLPLWRVSLVISSANG